MKNKIIVSIIIIFSIICGIIYEDYYLGTIILASGILNVYLASIGKTSNYIFGAVYYLVSAYVCFINGLNGLAVLSLIIYFPSQIQGYISWTNKKDKDSIVIVRGFTVKNSIIIVLSCILGSLLFSYILSKIPGQQLAFWDSSSNIINLCGVVLLSLRFKECWYVWMFNNAIDLYIWLVMVLRGSPNSIMMLIVSIAYFIINIYGLIVWQKRLQKNDSNN